jgi:hypothetical protein
MSRLIVRKLAHPVILLGLMLYAVVATSAASHIQDPKEATGSITGLVTLDGKPAPGVIVMATPSSSATSGPLGGLAPPTFLKTITDQEGRYRFTGLASDSYRVLPSAPALAAKSDARDGAKLVEVADGQTVEGVSFSLVRGGVITGKITDPDGRPVIAELISLKAVDGPGPPVNSPFGDRMYYTDDRGIYRIYGLPAGRYVVGSGAGSGIPSLDMFSQRRKYPPTYYPGVSDVSKAKAVEVAAGGETTAIDIQLGLTNKGFMVTGRVIDPETRKVVASGFVAYSRKKTGSEPAELRLISTEGASFGISPVSSKGEFKFDSVAPGRYEIEANSSLGVLGGDSQYFSEKIEFEVANGDITNLEVRVHTGASISGIVVVENPDNPDVLSHLSQLVISASRASTDQDSQESVARVSADGGFKLGGLKPGRVAFEVDEFSGASRYHIKRVELDGIDQSGGIDVQTNQQVAGVKIVLVYGSGTIRGRVIVQGGPLPKNASLRVTARLVGSEDVLGFAAVDNKGNFTIDNLQPGSYEVEANIYTRETEDESRTKISITKSVKQTVVVTNETPVEITLILDGKS